MNRAGYLASSGRTLRTAFILLLILSFPFAALHAQYDTGPQPAKEKGGPSAGRLYKMGQAAEQRGDFDAAYTDYQRAYQKNSKDLRFRTSMNRVRVTAAAQHIAKARQLEQSGDNQGALTEYMRAQEIDPSDEAAAQGINALRTRENQAPPAAAEANPDEARIQQELNSLGSPVELKPVENEPLTLHYTEDSKVVYQAIGKAAGINVLFDPDYSSKRVTVDLNNSTLLDALRIVGVISNTFWRPITPNTIFVAQNSRSKRTELDEQAVQTFYLTNAWQQNDLNDVQTALRNVLTNIKVYGLASQNALVVRGTPDELLLAQKLITDLDKARPEVVVDIAVLEVSKNWQRTLGIAWPQSVSVQLQSPTSTSTTTTCPTGSTTCTPTTGTGTTSSSPSLYNLAHLNSNDFAVTVGAATANLLLTDSNTRILQNPRLRATDMQKATMKIGEKIPEATGSFQSGIGGASIGGFPSAETQFQYIDVGVNIEVTPTVHFDNDVTLKMKIEVTAESGSTTIEGVTEPIIAQKSTEEVVRLREGEANIVSGILNQQDQQSWSGIPGLSSIPILKYLFGSKDHTITDDEIVFLVVPHVVRGVDMTPANMRAIDTGIGTNVELRRIAAEGPGANMPAQVQPVTTASIAPRVPTAAAQRVASVPGQQSASTAAPQALEQLKATAGGATEHVPQPNLNQPPGATPPPPDQGAQAPPPTGGPPPTTPPAAQGTQTPPPATAPASGAPSGAAQPEGQAAANQPAPSGPGVKLMMSPPGQVANGATFQVPVVISNATDIGSVPMQITYDPAKLSLVNVGSGDFLTRDGQAAALVHRDDGPGTITINASRPPGSPGVNGAGVVCMLSFQAKTPGQTTVAISKPGAVSSAQKPIPAQGTAILVNVK
ncbi:MAG TPA: cohesin domain-containing protein [Terracidiphilus sp.]|jgi:general secretion pathway protein D|nr:cohesin domain-containing protein [Terracidiphilus sp.]